MHTDLATIRGRAVPHWTSSLEVRNPAEGVRFVVSFDGDSSSSRISRVSGRIIELGRLCGAGIGGPLRMDGRGLDVPTA